MKPKCAKRKRQSEQIAFLIFGDFAQQPWYTVPDRPASIRHNTDKSTKEQNDMDRINMNTIVTGIRKEKVLYIFLLIGLVVMYGAFIPCLMDYYIVRPEQSCFSFFYDNFLKAPYMFESIVIGMAVAALYCLTLQTGVSTLIVSVLLFILTHASYIKYINRKELLKLDDLKLTEAAGMALDYFRFALNSWLVLLAGMLVLFAGAGFVLDWFGRKVWKGSEGARYVKKESENGQDAAKENHSRRNRRIMICVRMLGCVCLCAAIVLYTDHFLGARYVVDVVEPLVPETDRYVLYRFLQNDSLSTISVDRVEESYDYLLSKEPPKEAADGANYPNVIVIMNESWWDTDNIQTDRITFSQDPMEPYKELEDRCITGYLTSTVYGGGTVRSEIEFLTGLNAKYYRAASAYAPVHGRELPSLVDYFNGLDYETVAIHPYYGWYYDRDTTYAAMGFDRIIFEEDMQYRDIYTRYISDESLAKQIIAEIDTESGGPEFIWALSIANHKEVLDYTAEPAEDFDYPIDLELRGVELATDDYDTLVNYVNGIYLANQAFSQLVDYFSETDQPTVILMFGDHCPLFTPAVLKAFGLEDEGGDGERVKRLYSTPVIVWSNFSREEPVFSGESMYYLPQMLIDYAGLPDSDMMRILRYERSYFKTNSPRFVRDASGEPLYECNEEQLKALSHFKVVQYDILHGEVIGRDIWRPIIDRT